MSTKPLVKHYQLPSLVSNLGAAKKSSSGVWPSQRLLLTHTLFLPPLNALILQSTTSQYHSAQLTFKPPRLSPANKLLLWLLR